MNRDEEFLTTPWWFQRWAADHWRGDERPPTPEAEDVRARLDALGFTERTPQPRSLLDRIRSLIRRWA